MNKKLFFVSSKRVARRLTEVFDFVWPTAAAIWNLRWQVHGYAAANPTASEAELSGRFVAGSGIRAGNLRRACMETSWQDQQHEFARYLLTEFCSLYESWISGVFDELRQRDPKGQLAKALQFPTGVVAGNPTGGIQYALRALGATPSAVMTGALYSALTTNRKYSKAHLEELLICYRYFKEARNAFVHSGGRANQWFLDAETDYSHLTAASLGVSEVPGYTGHSLGDQLTLSLRGVVGFGDIVLRLVCTLDAEISVSLKAEAGFIARWKERHGNVSVSSNASQRAGNIKRLVRKLDLPEPAITPQFESWLRTNSLIN